jgi:flagellar motility protein MotE (MotC chaperone)
MRGKQAILALVLSLPVSCQLAAEEAGPAHSETPGHVAENKAAHEHEVQKAEAAQGSDAERFCANIQDEARERRYALKDAELKAITAEIDVKMKALEERRAEFEAWQKRREEFARLATDNLVDIYKKMRPAAAAERLAVLSTDLSASILMKLPSRQAGVILNEMEPETVAAITAIMAASSQRKDPV